MLQKPRAAIPNMSNNMPKLSTITPTIDGIIAPTVLSTNKLPILLILFYFTLPVIDNAIIL